MNKLPQRLETSRLTLRSAQLDDAEALFRVYCGVPDCARYLTRGVHTSTSQTAKFLDEWCAQAWTRELASFAWVVAERQTDSPIGTFVVIRNLDTAEVHFGIGKEYWGYGLVVEAGHAAIHWLFEDSNVRQLATVCDAEHMQSQRVLEKLGFQRGAYLQKHLVIPAFGSFARDGIRFSRAKA